MYRDGRGRILNRLKLMLTTRNMNWGERKTCMDYCSLVNVSIRMKIHQKGPLTRIPISPIRIPRVQLHLFWQFMRPCLDFESATTRTLSDHFTTVK